MTSATPSSSPQRDRVLVVGGSALADHVVEVLGPSAFRVTNLFEAIGEVATAPAAEPVAAVFVTADVLRRAGSGGIAALHQLDPSLRVVLLDDGDTPEIVEGIDARLAQRIDGAAALRLARGQDEGDEVAAVETPAEDLPALGDTDLVDRVLEDPATLPATALALIRQQTGWSDLRLVHDASQLPDGGARATLEHGDQDLGTLWASTADDEAMRDWAGWLARWLALASAHAELRDMAWRDDLTEAWNRRFYYAFMEQALETARTRRRPVTVMVFDIDDFKRYNDDYGHEAGDVILIETVSLLQSVIRRGDRVCRIGGDEFAVIFADLEGPREVGSSHPESVETIAQRFRQQIAGMKFPKLGLEAPGRLSISAGLATFPWDGQTAEALLRHADKLALRSKKNGKNAIMYGPDEDE